MEEETQAPKITTTMDIDLQESTQGHIADDAGKPRKNVMDEESQLTNGEATTHMEATAPKPPRVGYVQKQEGLVEDITNQRDFDMEMKQMEVGSSSQ
jgi:hypothetical protein